jgi:hypothetical protein
MKTYAIIDNNKVVNVIIAGDTFIPPDSTYVLTDTIVSVGDTYENGLFINNVITTQPTAILPLTLAEIDAILAAIENENNS